MPATASTVSLGIIDTIVAHVASPGVKGAEAGTVVEQFYTYNTLGPLTPVRSVRKRVLTELGSPQESPA
jgi:hypothetical protein